MFVANTLLKANTMFSLFHSRLLACVFVSFVLFECVWMDGGMDGGME